MEKLKRPIPSPWPVCALFPAAHRSHGRRQPFKLDHHQNTRGVTEMAVVYHFLNNVYPPCLVQPQSWPGNFPFTSNRDVNCVWHQSIPSIPSISNLVILVSLNNGNPKTVQTVGGLRVQKLTANTMPCILEELFSL